MKRGYFRGFDDLIPDQLLVGERNLIAIISCDLR